MTRFVPDVFVLRVLDSQFAVGIWVFEFGLGTSFGDEKSPFLWIFLLGIRGCLVVS